LKTGELSDGFSMLELVVALAMAAVLAAYAVPSYLAYVARGHRIDAVIALHRAAQSVAAAEAAGSAERGMGLGLPPGLSRVPEVGRLVYRLEWLRAGGASGGYELHAIPAADGPMRGDACGTFVLDALGGRSNLSQDGSGSSNPSPGIDDETASERCWSGRAA
jgi:type IV pilus assembly protein PilE